MVQVKPGLATKASPRVERLREKLFTYTPTVELDRIRILTEVFKETEDKPMVTRRARFFARLARRMPVNIYPDELIVGFAAGKPRGANLYIDIGGGWLEDELDTIATRQWDPCAISEEAKKELRENILPYWAGQGGYERTINGRSFHLFPPEVSNIVFTNAEAYPTCGTAVVAVDGPRYVQADHTTVDYPKVIQKGFLGIKREAEERLESLDLGDPESLERVTFLKAVVTALEAASEVGNGFAAKAKELAKGETDPKRKADLENIAEVCSRVPANPATTFHEALQSLWFTQILLFWESTATTASPGRCDQYLYPYYEKDVKEGRITKEEAQELLDCLLLKFSEAINLWPEDWARYVGGYPTTQHVNVGGLKANGSDATNELSYMFLEGLMHTRRAEPVTGVLLHSKTPEDFLIKACEVGSLGIAQPLFFNAEVVISSLVGTQGGPLVPLALARDKVNMAGCVEPCVSGLGSGGNLGFINGPAAMEFVMTNGVSRVFQRRMGIETGDPRKFESFEEVMEALKKQLAWLTRNLAIGLNIGDQTVAELLPTPYQSALMGDCIEKGLDKQAGGARYNFGFAHVFVGIADVADSLAAIKRLVFDEKKISMDELCEALDKDFEGYEELRRMLLDAPKWGNDDDYVDLLTADVLHSWASEVIRYKNTRGGYQSPAINPGSSNVSMGMVVGALPSGRKAEAFLADGCSAYAGMDKSGLTAALNSYSKIDHAEITGGTLLNMRIDPAVFKDGREGVKRFADLMRVFVDLKMMHIQFNVVSSDTLRAAQKEPDKYRDMVVKVAGYSAFFVELDESLQNAIIMRTELTL